jgi:hypothetical protein
VNLLFFTVELERTRPEDRALHLQTHFGDSRRPPRPHAFTVVVVAALCVSAAVAAGWVIGGGGTGPLTDNLPDWIPVATGASARSGDAVELDITSAPNNATVRADGQERGKTPLSLTVARGQHTLALTHPSAVDEERKLYATSDMHVNVAMFERRPDALQLKPVYPGAAVNGATFLDDGRLAVTMGLPSTAAGPGNSQRGMLNEAWILDPVRGSLVPFATTSNPRAQIVVVSPDGRHVAYAQPHQTDAGGSRLLAEVLIVGADSGSTVLVFSLPPVDASRGAGVAPNGELEDVADIAWTPDGRHLLVTLRLVGLANGPPSASRSRVLLVDAGLADGQQAAPVELLRLPAEVVRGSYNWAPDGNWVAFLTRVSSGVGGTDFVALCALDISKGGDVSGFRYVADLGRETDPRGPLPAADVAWSPTGDGRLMYVAATPRFTVSNPLGLPTTSGGEPGLFLTSPSGPALTAEEGQRFGLATGLFGMTWLPSDEAGSSRLLALGRSDKGSKPLVMRVVDAGSGVPQTLDVTLPNAVGGSAAVAARWDVRHGRLLLLAHRDNSTAALDFWLVQVRADGTGV